MASPEQTSATAVDFISTVFGNQFPDGASVMLFEMGQARPRTHSIRQPGEVADLVDASRREKTNLYVAVAYQDAKVRSIGSRRNTAATAIGIPAMWLDIDVKDGGAADLEHARAIAEAVTTPTVIVHSGGGLHAWWVLDEPWMFIDQADRSHAEACSRGWQEAHRHANPGIHIDSTHDLARVLRVPGTLSIKPGREPREVVGFPTGNGKVSRQQLVDVGEAASPTPTTRPTRTVKDVDPDLVFDPNGKPNPLLWMAAFENDADVVNYFNHRWKVPGRGADQSDSSYEFLIGSQAHKAGWPLQDVLNLMIWHRSTRPDPNGKVRREDYFAMTLSSIVGGSDPVEALPSVQQMQDERWREARQATLELQAESSFELAPDEVLRRFNAVIACGAERAPRVVRVEQFGRDVSKTQYRLHLNDADFDLSLSPQQLFEPRQFRIAFAATTRHYMERLPTAQDWARVIQVLLDVCVVHEVPSANPDVLISACRSLADRYGIAENRGESQDPVAGDRPFLEDDKVWFTGASIKEAIKAEPGAINGDLQTAMRIAFGESRRFNVDRGGRRTSRRCYGIDASTLDD